MRQDSIEFGFAAAIGHARRIARTRDRRHLGTKTASNLPPAVIDEALAGFEAIDAGAALRVTANPSGQWLPIKNSLVANLAVQLEALDRQRQQLSELLRSIDSASIAE